MIVDPDFFDHWRTQMVADMLGGDPLAALYVMRLWAHCQNRRGDSFAIPTAGIKALCKFTGDGDALEAALIAAEYLTRDGATVTVVGWAEKNASLLAAWENGGKGGRPKKVQPEPAANPLETHGLAEGSPGQTQAEPIREEKRREEKKTGGKPPEPPVPDWVDPLSWADFVAMRKAIRKPMTDAAKRLAFAELEKLRDQGEDPAEVLRQSVFRGWQGLFPVKPQDRAPPGAVTTMSPHGQQTMRNAEALEARIFGA